MGRIKNNKFFSFFLEIISFKKPKDIVINLLIIILLSIFLPLGFFKEKSFCVWKNFILPFIFKGNCPKTGIFAGCECLGCGLTRAMISLFDGNFIEAINYNILVIPTILGIFALLIYNIFLIFKKKNSYKLI